MTPSEALTNLYTISRQAPLTADGHEQARKLAEIILKEIEPKDETKTTNKKKSA